MEYEEFESELGNVAVTDDHIERESRESEKWGKIKENFSSEELVDRIHFSKIDELDFRTGSMFPHVLLKINDEWKRLFFLEDEDAHECFKYIRYRRNVFLQNYQ